MNRARTNKSFVLQDGGYLSIKENPNSVLMIYIIGVRNFFKVDIVLFSCGDKCR